MDKQHLQSILSKYDYDLSAYDNEGKYPAEMASALLSHGLFETQSAETLVDFAELCGRIELLAILSNDGGLNFSLAASHLAGVLSLEKHLTNEQKKALFDDKPLAHCLIANAMSESSSGSDAFNMTCTADKKGDSYVLNGTKCFVSNAGNADVYIVYALTDKSKGAFGGISAFLVKKEEVSVGINYDTHGLRTCGLADVVLSDVEVSSDRLIGKEGAALTLFMEAMNAERIGLAAMHLGTMIRVWGNVKAFVNERGGAKKIIGHSAVEDRMFKMYMLLDASNLQLKASIQAFKDNAEVMKRSSICKFVISENLVEFCQLAMRTYAGNGFTKAYDIERVTRDAQAALTYSGTNDIQKNIILKHLNI